MVMRTRKQDIFVDQVLCLLRNCLRLTVLSISWSWPYHKKESCSNFQFFYICTTSSCSTKTSDATLVGLGRQLPIRRLHPKNTNCTSRATQITQPKRRFIIFSIYSNELCSTTASCGYIRVLLLVFSFSTDQTHKKRETARCETSVECDVHLKNCFPESLVKDKSVVTPKYFETF